MIAEIYSAFWKTLLTLVFLWDLFAVRKIWNDTRLSIWTALYRQTMLQTETSLELMAHNKWWNKQETTNAPFLWFHAFCLLLLKKGNFETSQCAAIRHGRQTSWQQPSSAIKWCTVRVYHYSGYVPTLLCHCLQNLHVEETRSSGVKPLWESGRRYKDLLSNAVKNRGSEIHSMSAAFEAETPQCCPCSSLLRLIMLVFTRPWTQLLQCQTTSRTQQRCWKTERKEQVLNVCERWEQENTECLSDAPHKFFVVLLTLLQVKLDFMFRYS